MKILLLLASIFIFNQLIAQEQPFCATDEIHQQIFTDHPEYNPGIIRAHNELQSFTHNFINSPQSKVNATYIIPVVFHVIHNNGPENINDSQILDAIKQVNIQYRKLNADTSEIVSAFKSLASDIDVELRLAQIDPNGNCTSGITRTVSPLTYSGTHDVKSLVHWPPDKYLNVYVCDQAAGLAGHALLPSAADTIPQWDGIVMQHSYVGTTGTSDYFRRTVLSHEIGHFLNLQHIWGGNNVPDYYYLPVAQSGNCSFDDDVADTPLTIGWQTCNLSGASCSSLDNVQNYMDYSYCARMFTEGQKTRMHACLNSSVADRNNLWSPSNLIATGTDDVTYELCTVKFEANKQLICTGETLTLTDVSRHGVTGRTWTINGGNASSLSDSIVTATYNTPGIYSISLNVTNGSKQLDTTYQDYIRVLPSTGENDYMIEHFENENDFNDKWIILENNSNYNWEINTSTGRQSIQSIFINNYDANETNKYEFISSTIDASNLSAIAVSFDRAYSKSAPTVFETLQFAVSNDCGETWAVRKTYSGAGSLITYDTELPSPFYPTQDEQWKNETITNIPTSYLTEGFMVKFIFNSAGGNNIFIDNILISHPDILETKEKLLNQVKAFPNPTENNLTVELPHQIEIQSLVLTETNGKVLPISYSMDNSSFNLSLEHLNSGIYFLNIISDIGNRTIKITKN